jgi:N-acetylneuraminic acid mutarotase
MRKISVSAFFNPRTLVTLLLCAAAACSMLAGTLLAFFRSDAPVKIQLQRCSIAGTVSHSAVTGLTFAQRVSYQRAIEDVYWRHRIWPAERTDPKPSLNTVMSPAQLEKKVTDYLRRSQALEDYWQRPITAEQLQAEMDRMAKNTKQPDVLRELFAALGDDPSVIAECLARPTLAERTSATVASKEPLPTSQFRVENQMPNGMTAAAASYTVPTISNGAIGCIDDTWRPSPIDSRSGHTAVWTGSEMIVWGGSGNSSYLNTGGRYDPATDSWLATSTANAPIARSGHTAVWTGSEMIVWGGISNSSYLNTGGKYNPGTDSWTTTSTGNAPTGRYNHTAVWTGSKMIVWGGSGKRPPNYLDPDRRSSAQFTPALTPTPTPTATPDIGTGGRYDPSTDSWTTTSITNAPIARVSHAAVWTGGEMIVWGGHNSGGYLNTGGRYNPTTNNWTATNMVNAPDSRSGHTAVWTGGAMIVWGGNNGSSVLNTGGRYNPTTDNWIPTSATSSPSAREFHTAVWTGSEMTVWGGYDGRDLNTGGRYNPGTDTWRDTSTVNAPTGRYFHTAVWSGIEMIVWGGHNDSNRELNTGGRHNPMSDNWTETSPGDAPSPRSGPTSVWSGSEMIVWGGLNDFSGFLNTGGKYSPGTDRWTATSTTNAPMGRVDQTAVWTGSEMIVWGGFNFDQGLLNTGGRYNPAMDEWTATSTVKAPSERRSHTAVWTGTEMIVWGGSGACGTGYCDTGGRYNPITDSWTATSTANAPSPRHFHTAVWTGSEMIVWGGCNGEPCTPLNTGGRYNPTTDNWTATSMANAPSARDYHTAVWIGSEMIIWGGESSALAANIVPQAPSPSPTPSNDGGRYDPDTDTWTATSTVNAPDARAGHTAVWTGSEMIVWGGANGSDVLNTGGRYNAETNSWTATTTTNAPIGRGDHTAVWTGGEMIVWGGQAGITYLDSGGRYCAASGPTPTPTATPTPTPTATATPTTTPSATPTATPTATVRPTPTVRPNITPRSRPTPPPRP